MTEKFPFLKIYADSITKLSEWDEQLAKDLCWKIVLYWIYGTFTETNPIVDAMFISFKTMIDRWKEIQQTNIENWKKWWAPKWNQNAVKNFENISKQPKTTEIQPKNNQKTTDEQPKTSKIENIKYKIENNNINNLISKDIKSETKVSEYWNPEINECVELIKKYNGWIIDWTVKDSRRYSKLLIDKIKKLESVQNWNYTRQATLEIILNIISNNKYYSSKITSPELIFRNLAILMQQCKKDVTKTQIQNTVLESI